MIFYLFISSYYQLICPNMQATRTSFLNNLFIHFLPTVHNKKKIVFPLILSLLSNLNKRRVVPIRTSFILLTPFKRRCYPKINSFSETQELYIGIRFSSNRHLVARRPLTASRYMYIFTLSCSLEHHFRSESIYFLPFLLKT